MTTQKQKPAHEFRIGSIKAAIWANESQKTGTWYCVTFQRSYKTADGWKHTSGFGVDDLPEVSRLAERAANWIELLTKRPVQLGLTTMIQPAA